LFYYWQVVYLRNQPKKQVNTCNRADYILSCVGHKTIKRAWFCDHAKLEWPSVANVRSVNARPSVGYYTENCMIRAGSAHRQSILQY